MRAEEILVRRLTAGDKEAFEEFYRQNQARLYRFVRGKIGEDKDAEEVTQDTWLSFLDSLPLFRFGSSLVTFLFAIARHEIADYFRKRYAKKAIKLVPFVGRVYSEDLYTAELVAGEMAGAVDRVYEMIEPMQRRILRMKYEEEMSVKEIAKRLTMSVKAVESKLFRARKAFQIAFNEVAEKERE